VVVMVVIIQFHLRLLNQHQVVTMMQMLVQKMEVKIMKKKEVVKTKKKKEKNKTLLILILSNAFYWFMSIFISAFIENIILF
jgi:hypothetical protein